MHFVPHNLFFTLYCKRTIVPHHGILIFVVLTLQCSGNIIIGWKFEFQDRSWLVPLTKCFMPVCWTYLYYGNSCVKIVSLINWIVFVPNTLSIAVRKVKLVQTVSAFINKLRTFYLFFLVFNFFVLILDCSSNKVLYASLLNISVLRKLLC
jgi:hypothetical protein